MDKLGLGVLLFAVLGAGCQKPELGLGELKGDADSGAPGGETGAAGLEQDAQVGTGGERAQGGSGGRAQDGTGGQKAQDGTGGQKAQDGTGGKDQPDASAGQGGGSVEPIEATGGTGEAVPDCTELSESACRSTDGCDPIHGSDDGTSPGTVFAGCQPSGRYCTTVMQCAYPAGTSERCLLFPDCVPEGWRTDTACSAQGCPPLPWQTQGTGGTGGGSGSAGAGNDCSEPLTMCGGSCVDLKSNAAHCGDCDTACTDGETCVDGSCSCFDGLASPEELASTPRESTNLEQLALSHSDGIVADQDVYDRVVRDVTRIRDQAQDVADIEYWPPNDGKQLLLLVDADTFAAMQSGSYSDWNCLLDSYSVTDTTYDELTSLEMYMVLVELKGLYRLDPIAAQFTELSGVSSAEPNYGMGDGPTICLTQGDSLWHYVFDRAGGDCPAGCTTHSYTYFTVSSDGATIERLGAWDSEASSSPMPDWVTQYASAQACR